MNERQQGRPTHTAPFVIFFGSKISRGERVSAGGSAPTSLPKFLNFGPRPPQAQNTPPQAQKHTTAGADIL